MDGHGHRHGHGHGHGHVPRKPFMRESFGEMQCRGVRNTCKTGFLRACGVPAESNYTFNKIILHEIYRVTCGEPWSGTTSSADFEQVFSIAMFMTCRKNYFLCRFSMKMPGFEVKENSWHGLRARVCTKVGRKPESS